MKVTKKTRLLAAVPIDQTEDGETAVMSFKDNGQSSPFYWGHDWKMKGKGLSIDGLPGHWSMTSMTLQLTPDATEGYGLMPEDFADDMKSGTLKPTPMTATPPEGTYPNAVVVINLMQPEEPIRVDGLELPINLVVEQ